ncbi:MAG: hypothetical protein HUJ93_08880, partial [Bacteroidales bacterium]|nr:hypothetical protein [Bacteroidales bacterium]
MSIRSNAIGHYGDLSPELKELLRRNGMQAHLVWEGGDPVLAVQGHDSPLLSYRLSSQQLLALTDGGTNYTNKNAYNTFAEIVGKDFHVPNDYVHARNANGRVAMGLHGYRIGTGEYGRPDGRMVVPMDMWRQRGILGWTPRQQDGWHLRRVGGELRFGGAPMVADRPDGRMKPGELQNGGYGFYYKGQQAESQQQTPREEILRQLQNIEPVIQTRPRSTEPAKAYSEIITSDVYFSNEKLQDILSSHGIVVDAEKKTLTIQSASINKDFLYDLTEDEVKKLTNDSIKDNPVEKRLTLINDIIRSDYQQDITMDMLNSKEQIAIAIRPEVIEELRQAQQLLSSSKQYDSSPIMDWQMMPDPMVQGREDARMGIARVDGRSLYEMENQAWFREGQYGREVSVEEIKVEPMMNVMTEREKEPRQEMKYRMTAVINGESISHEITQRQYDKFMAVDDYHRMKLFSK